MSWFASGFRIVPTAFVAGLLPLHAIQGQALQCDPTTVSAAMGDFGYREREGRCEGVYSQKVSGTVLSLASLTESFEEYNPSSGDDLILQWPRYGVAGVQLRARTITQRLHYRMEAVRPMADTAYRWPSNVLQAQSIQRSELGVTASVPQTVGGANRQIYLPLRIVQARSTAGGSQPPPPSHGAYELVIYPTAKLTQLFLTVAAVGADGQPSTFIKRDEELACEYCPADQPITVRLAGLKAAGIYFVEIGARLAGGGSTAIQQWLYHPGSLTL